MFDRWGAQVFHGTDLPLNDPSSGWDGYRKGQSAQDGIYVWMAEVEFIDGAIELFEGSVVLLW